MRIAIVSDIHGNLTAFEAVLADLRETSPDLVLHGGDLPHGGSSPCEIVDRIRDLGWAGVLGNTDEMLFQPASLAGLPPSLMAPIQEMAAWTLDQLGEERIAWLRELPFRQQRGPMALVHASPESCWKGPSPTASDEELEKTFSPLGKPVAIYGHIHHPFVRSVQGMTVANTGSVSLSYDGDRRLSYLLIDDETPSIRRVEYDVDRELKALAACGLPHWEWVAKMLQSARPQMP